MNKIIRTLAALAAFAAGFTALQAQPAVKLVVVDLARVHDNHYKSEEDTAKFRDAEQKAQEQVEELNKQGQALVEDVPWLVAKVRLDHEPHARAVCGQSGVEPAEPGKRADAQGKRSVRSLAGS